MYNTCTTDHKIGALVSENSEKPRPPTGVRLPPALEEAVRVSAEASGRTLSAEIRALIERGLSGGRADDALFGETPAEVDYNRAVGDAAALVRRQVGQWNDPRGEGTWEPGRYVNVAAAAAAAELLTHLPAADELNAEEQAEAAEVGRSTAQQLLRELKGAPRRPALAALARALRLQQE
jgi:plasmid stability protein